MERVACTLNDGQRDERRERWQRLARRAFADRVATDDGLRLVFRNGPGVEDELRELAELERDCCAFATWSVASADGAAWIEVAAASDEGVAALHAMFRSLARPA